METKQTSTSTGLAKQKQDQSIQLYVQPEELVPYEQGLSARNTDYLIGMKSPRIADLPEGKVHEQLDMFVEKVFVDIGDRKSENEDKEILSNLFAQEMLHDFSSLSLQDIKNALHHGARGEYTQKIFLNMGTSSLSLVMMRSWVKEYVGSRDRMNVVINQTRFDQKEELKKSEAMKAQFYEKEKIKNLDIFCNAYNKSLAKGRFMILKSENHILDLTNNYSALYWYNYLAEEAKLLVMDNQEKAKMWERARAEMETAFASAVVLNTFDRAASQNKILLATIPFKYDEAAKKLSEFTKAQKDIMEDIKLKAKQKSVTEFLVKSIENRVNLTEQIAKYEKTKTVIP